MLQPITYHLSSDMFSTNSEDRKWYLNRIRGEACKVVHFDLTSIPKYLQTPKPFNENCYTTPEVVLVILSFIGSTETMYLVRVISFNKISLHWNKKRSSSCFVMKQEIPLCDSPWKAYIFTIFIFIGFCLGYDMPSSRKENIEKGNVSKLVAKYEETIAATDGSNTKPLLKRLPNGSITGRNRFQTTPSQI